MSEPFYVTLPSHSNKDEHPNNASNHFKIRLPHPIRLEGDGWKVGLVSISLPDPTSQLPPLIRVDDDADLFYTGWMAEKRASDGSISHRAFDATFQPRDLRKEDLTTLTGKGLMNTAKSFFEKKKIEKVLEGGWKLSDDDGGNRTYVHFKWEGDDFVLDNSSVKLGKVISVSYYPHFHVNADLAVEMGWFKELGNDKYGIGPNLAIEIPGGTTPVPLDTDIEQTHRNEYWTYVTDKKLIKMTMKCNWRFINLNTSFKNIMDSTKRSLFIYSDVGGSGVVGDQVTDLLREVNYQREGKGSNYFEPLHIQYIPVRKEVLDIIEVQVSETTGTLTEFGEGNTIVTLHFTKS